MPWGMRETMTKNYAAATCKTYAGKVRQKKVQNYNHAT